MTEKITVSYSEIDAYRQCPYKHYLAYGERFSKPVAVDSTLGKGTAWHEVLQIYYGALKASYDFEHAYAVAAVRIQEMPPEIQALLSWMLEGYVTVYPKDFLFWEIMAVEATIVAPLLDENGNETRFDLKAKIDLIVRDKRNDLVSVVDHKSTSALRDKGFEWEEQFGLYELVANRAGFNVFNTVHSAALTKMNKGDLLKPGDDGYKGNMKETPLDSRFKRT
jgi:RecB family exonuclease